MAPAWLCQCLWIFTPVTLSLLGIGCGFGLLDAPVLDELYPCYVLFGFFLLTSDKNPRQVWQLGRAFFQGLNRLGIPGRFTAIDQALYW